MSRHLLTCMCSFCCLVTILVVLIVAKLLVPWSAIIAAAAWLTLLRCFLELFSVSPPISTGKTMDIKFLIFIDKFYLPAGRLFVLLDWLLAETPTECILCSEVTELLFELSPPVCSSGVSSTSSTSQI